MSDPEHQLGQQHEQSISKYTYFLMAFAGSCIALSVSRTTGTQPSWDHCILLAAVLCWGVSIYFGLTSIRYKQSNMYANIVLLKAQRGAHPDVGTNPQHIKAACEGISKAFHNNDEKSSWYARWQLKLLIFGATLFIAWHVVDMFKS